MFAPLAPMIPASSAVAMTDPFAARPSTAIANASAEQRTRPSATARRTVGGLAETIEQGTRRAEEAIDSGAARDVLERFVERTRA